MKLNYVLGLHAIGSVVFGALAFGAAAKAEPIRHPTATFAGLDKTTGRIINFDVAIEETVQFGALQVTPRVCNTRSQTEAPQTTSFVEVDELIAKPGRTDVQVDRVKANAKVDAKDAKRIFSGWMFAASPGLHGVEHPVYDVWLVDCKGGKETAQTVAAPAPAPPVAEEGGKKHRSRRVEPSAPPPVENQPIGPADASDGALSDPTVAPEAAAAPEAAPEPVKKKKKKKRAKPRADDPALTPLEPSGGNNPLMPF